MYPFLLLCICSFLPTISRAVLGTGGSCSASKNHLDPTSHKFVSQCSDLTFCSVASGALNDTGLCEPRLCRRDEFPFGYSATDVLPPLCPASSSTYCPDEGSGCRPLVEVGGPCQLNRDEQCAAPIDWEDLAGSQNFNGSVCLQSICMCVGSSLFP